MPFCTNCGASYNPGDKFCNECGSPLQTLTGDQHTQPAPMPAEAQQPEAPTVLDGFIQPGLPVKVYSIFFFGDRLVACKSGSVTTHAAGTMSAAMGGSAAGRMQGWAIGALMDVASSGRRQGKIQQLAADTPEGMAAADKANFMLMYASIQLVEVKGPNWAGETHVKVKAAGKEHKFRLDNQSKESVAYVAKVFSENLPGKVTAV